MNAVLTINGGSSSIRFAVFSTGKKPQLQVSGKIERIGLPKPLLTISGHTEKRIIPAATHEAAAKFLVNYLQGNKTNIIGVGHRVVHGGPKYWLPKKVDQKMLKELRRISPFDPEHLPSEIHLIEVFGRAYPGVPQIACFDTAFHHDMPRVAQILPIPRKFEADGLRRYGFHGLSYAFIMEELRREVGPKAAQGRVIIAHLGNGASLAAVRGGKGMDTSMGFTPTAGIPMSTRTGDLDPGVLWFLASEKGMSPKKIQAMVNHESGLLGISETSPDMRDLLAREATDVRAAEAVALFDYQVKKWIGSFAAVLGGLDTLIFTGGIGENQPLTRSRICEGLDFLGIRLDKGRNKANVGVISGVASRVTVRVMRTNEELMIARAVCRLNK